METRIEGLPRMDDEGSKGEATNICINDVVSFHDAEKMMYCRLCATVNNDAVSIFGEEGVLLNLAHKINVALPIWVSSNMGPPLHVCSKCIVNLDATVNFINQVVAAQKKINTVFKVLQDISKRNLPTAVNRDTSVPAFITYFRAKNFKKLDSINRTPNQKENDKENEGEQHKTAVSHLQKKVNDALIPLAIEESTSVENEAVATVEPPVVCISDDDSLGEDDARDDFDEPVEDVEETDKTTSTGVEVIEVVENQEKCTPSDPKADQNSYPKDTPNATKSSKESFNNVCKYCQKSFKWNTELLFHQTSVHKDVVFCCSVCFKVFHDDKEEFEKHLKSHLIKSKRDCVKVSEESTSTSAGANQYTNTDMLSVPTNVTNVPSVGESCTMLTQSKSQGQKRLSYKCKYCNKIYLKLRNLFSHQTEDHPESVFRCIYCSKVFYDNEEELMNHEESHGVQINKYKLSEGGKSDQTKAMKNRLPTTKVVYSILTEKQQEWVDRILADRPKKRVPVNISNITSSPSVNTSTNDSSPSVSASAHTSTSVNSADITSTSTTEIADFSTPVKPRTPEKLDSKVKENRPAPVVMNLPKCYPAQVVSHTSDTHPFMREKKFLCRPCQLSFKTQEEREFHRMLHHQLKLPCRYCPRTLAHRSNLLEHEASHFKKPKLKCKKCEEEFEDLETLKKHKRRQCITHTLPRFSCQICKRMYIRENELKIHLETHLDERPFLCEKCGQCFKDVSSLSDHRRTPCKARGFTRGYECDVCGKKWNNARLLARHRIHHHRAMYPCPLCGLVFRSKPSMSAHMKSHSEILCLVCNERFDTLHQMQSHRKQEHPEEEMTEFSAFQNEGPVSVPKLRCEVCDKCFATKLTLNAHKATHANVPAWQCHLCNEAFDSRLRLENHMSSHPGEQPYKCHICDQTFSLHMNLLEHEKMHFQDCQTCEKCGKSFPTTLELSKHMAEHPSYDAFTCAFCSMSFSRKISLLIHQRTHTNKVYSCSVCSANFSTLSLAEKHERSHGRNNKEDASMASTEVDEDALAVSLLNMGDTALEVSSADHVLEEVISSARAGSSHYVDVKEVVHSSIIIDPVYSEVVYVSNALDDIL